MPRDLKVGFALGVLLVGVVGALFFRRDAAVSSAPPALASAKEIDKELAEQPKGPYMLGPEEFVAEEQEAAAKPRKLPRSNPPAYEVPEFLDDADRRDQQAVTKGTGTPAPDPVTAEGNSRQTVKGGVARGGNAKSMPQHNTGWETTGRAPAAISIDGVDALDDDTPFTKSADPVRDTAAAPGTTTYTTRHGDTLSSLAGKFMGSQGRFRELYEMNRHVLRSPDEVPEGVTLTVPAQVPAPRSTATSTRNTRKTGASSAGQGWDPVSEQPAAPPTEPRARESAANPEARQPSDETSPVVAKDRGNREGSMFRASQRGRLGAGRQKDE